MSDHIHFMALAIENARQALDAGEFPVGCIIADGDKTLADGSRKNSLGTTPGETDHAEINTLNALEQQERDTGRSFDRSRLTLYSTLEPCLMCFGAILINGINTIVYAVEDVMGGGTSCDLKSLPPLYSQRRITIVPDVMRQESLALLKNFFSDPARTYLKDTMLADHVLNS
jgi:tRNA(adenine34) deaminase